MNLDFDLRRLTSVWQTVWFPFHSHLFISQARFSFLPGSLLNSFFSYFLLSQASLHCFWSFLRDIYCCNNRKKGPCYVFPNTVFQLDPVEKDKVTDCAKCLSTPKFPSALAIHKLYCWVYTLTTNNSTLLPFKWLIMENTKKFPMHIFLEYEIFYIIFCITL